MIDRLTAAMGQISASCPLLESVVTTRSPVQERVLFPDRGLI